MTNAVQNKTFSESHKLSNSAKHSDVLAGLPLSRTEASMGSNNNPSDESSAPSTYTRKKIKREKRSLALNGDEKGHEKSANSNSPAQDDVATSTTTSLFQKRRITFWIDQSPFIFTPVQQIPTEDTVEAVMCLSTQAFLNSNCQDEEKVVSNEKEYQLRQLVNICPWVIVTGGQNGTLTVWNPVKRVAHVTVPATNTLRSSAIVYLKLYRSSEGVPQMVMAASDYTISFWDLPKLTRTKLLLGHSKELIHCQFVPIPAAHYQTTSSAQSIRDTDDVRKEKDTVSLHQKVLLLRSDPDCALVEMAFKNGVLRRTSGALLQGHQDTILTADVSPDGCWVATGAKDHTLRVWSVRAEKNVLVIRGHTAPVVALQVTKRPLKSTPCSCSPTPSMEKSSSACSTLTEQPSMSLLPTPGSLGFMIVSVCLEGILKVWMVNRDVLRHRLNATVANSSAPLELETSTASVTAHDKLVNALAMAPNDKLVATGSSDKTVKIWSLPNLQLLGVCRGHTRAVWAVRFSPVEKVIASGSGDATIKLWSLKDFTCLKTFQGHTNSVLGIEFLSAGTQLLSCSSDSHIRLWSIRTSTCISVFEQHEGAKVWSIGLNNSRNRMVSAGADGRAFIWDDTTEQAEREELEKDRLSEAQIQEIESLARQGRTLDALGYAIQHRRQFQARTILENSCEAHLFQPFEAEYEVDAATSTGVSKILRQQRKAKEMKPVSAADLSQWLTSLSQENLGILAQFIIKWNTNGQTSSLANSLLSLLLEHVPSDKLVKIEGFPNLVAGFLAYTPRHVNRLSSLVQRSFVLDLILTASKSLQFSDVPDLPDRLSTTTTPKAQSSLPPHSPAPLSLSDAYCVLFE